MLENVRAIDESHVKELVTSVTMANTCLT